MSKHERTGWRDEKISLRHRSWGFNCPAVDLDFLMVEYNLGKPAAIVEYKHDGAQMPSLKHPTYRALIDLANGYFPDGLPFIVAFYCNENWWFRVYPINTLAKKWFDEGEIMSEREYVTRLYKIRGWVVEQDVLINLSDYVPAHINDR